MIKKIIKRTIYGISYGCFWLVGFSMIFNFMQDRTHFEAIMSNFTIQAIGSILVGIGFVLPTLIYDSEKLPLFVKTIVHLGIGVLLFFAVGFYLGWLPIDFGIGRIFLVIMIGIVVSIVIWLCFYLYYRNEGKIINQRLKKVEEKE